MAFGTTASLAGLRLGGCVLESLVGVCGMAEVYRVRALAFAGTSYHVSLAATDLVTGRQATDALAVRAPL